jgi:hypothetical protein
MASIAEIVAKAIEEAGGAGAWALLTARERTRAVYDTMRALDSLATTSSPSAAQFRPTY